MGAMDRTDLGRRAWRARHTAGTTARRARATTARIGLGIASGIAVIVAALVGHALLGRLGEPFALLVALPPLAAALASFGLRDVLARRVAAIPTGERRLVAAYGLWLGTSALLSLPVAAVAASSVAMAIGRDHGERRWQLGAAAVGSSLGSVLFPFSSVATLVLVAGSGISLAAWLGVAIPAGVAAAAAGGALLFSRFLVDQDADRDDSPAVDEPPLRYAPARGDGRAPTDPASLVATSLAGAVAIVAVVSGLAGGSMVWPFVAGAAILTGWAVGSGRLEPEPLVRRAPLPAVAVLVGGAILAGPIAAVAGVLPRPVDLGPVTLASVALTGAVLAALVSTLPAAVLGAAWLGVASPALLVAFVVGANLATLAMPRGSVATIVLASRTGPRRRDAARRPAVPDAWHVFLAAGSAAIVALALAAIR
jgi:hypothetical protein